MITDKVFKRDRRRKFEGKLLQKHDLNDIMTASLSYLQSMYAEYSKEELPLTTIIQENKRFEDIYVDRHNEMDSVSTRIADSIVDTFWIESRVNKFFEIVPNAHKEVFGLNSTAEIEVAECFGRARFYKTLLRLAIVRKYGKDTPEARRDFLLQVIGNDLDKWTEIYSCGRLKKLEHLMRVIPANDTLGTPTFTLIHRTWTE